MNKTEFKEKYINGFENIDELVDDCLCTVNEHYNQKLHDLSFHPRRDLLILRYAIFYSNPLNTLEPGDIYFMGYNPGGSLTDKNGDIIDYPFENMEFYRTNENYSAFDEDWNGNPGNDKHQRSAKDILNCTLKILGNEDSTYLDVFCTNLCFYRSKDINSLIPYFEDFMDIHRVFLNIIQPKIIICNGNGDNDSCYNSLKELNEFPMLGEENIVPLYNNFSIKWFYSQNRNWTEENIIVIGLPHLSHANPMFNNIYEDLLKNALKTN